VSAAALRFLLRGVFMLSVCLVLGGRAFSANPTFTATLDRTVVTIGSVAELTFTVENGTPDLAPALPQLPNAQVTGPATGNMASMTITPSGAQRVSRRTYTFTILPMNAGTVSIPAVEVVVDGKRLKSQPISLRAIASSAGNQPGAAPTDDSGQAKTVFLNLSTARTNAFLGETVPFEIKLYAAAGAQLLQLPQLGGDGFMHGRVIADRQQREVINGITYNTITYRSSGTATKAGPLVLGPATMEVMLQDPSRGTDIFGRPQAVVRTGLKSDEVPIQVLPLPGNRPEGFNGAVGTFTLSLEASPTNVVVGDPITVRIQIAGQGNIEMLRLPEQAGWRDFQKYDPNSRFEVEPLGLSGKAFFEWVVAPQNAAVAALPPFVFSFFNPATQRFETIKTEAVPITVRATAEAQPSIAATGPKADGKTVEFAHIRPTLGALSTPPAQLIEQPLFWIFNALAPVGWFAARLLRKRREALASDPELGRKKNVSRRVRAGLADLAVRAKNDEVEPFFATAFRLLQEQLGERLRLPASGITESILDDRLRAKGVSEDLLSRCHQIFQACNNARYAGHQTSAELASWIPRIESVLCDLQKVK
jgi:hypothetical protein